MDRHAKLTATWKKQSFIPWPSADESRPSAERQKKNSWRKLQPEERWSGKTSTVSKRWSGSWSRSRLAHVKSSAAEDSGRNSEQRIWPTWCMWTSVILWLRNTSIIRLNVVMVKVSVWFQTGKTFRLFPTSPLREIVFVVIWPAGRSDLVLLRSGFKTISATYIENSLNPLLPSLTPYLYLKKIIFNQDLASAHRTKKTQPFLD